MFYSKFQHLVFCLKLEQTEENLYASKQKETLLTFLEKCEVSYPVWIALRLFLKINKKACREKHLLSLQAGPLTIYRRYLHPP